MFDVVVSPGILCTVDWGFWSLGLGLRAGGLCHSFSHRNLPFRAGFRMCSGIVFEVHRLLYHSTLGLRVIRKPNKGSGFTPSPLPSEEALNTLKGFKL
jgi:hypothetical protein